MAEFSGAAPQRREAALQRLQASRERVALCLLPPPAEPGPDGAPRPWRAWWRHLRRRLAGSPLGPALTEAAQAWWQQQPLRPLMQALQGGWRQGVQPLLRRHPLAGLGLAAGLAAGAGVLLVRQRRPLLQQARRWARPWPGRFTRWAWAQARQPAVQLAVATWLAQQLPAATSDPPVSDMSYSGDRPGPMSGAGTPT